MGRRVRRPDVLTRGGEPWTGEIAFDVRSDRGTFIGRLELVIERNQVAVGYSGRRLAQFRREDLGRWLAEPERECRAGDIRFVMRRRTLSIALDASSPFPVPAQVAAKLRAAI